jgi:Ribbon-helix-helix protein, copG family
MNITIYIRKELANQINKLCRRFNKSRNSVINEALEHWIQEHETRKWPENFFDFEPIVEVPNFKSLRKEFKEESTEDPLK